MHLFAPLFLVTTDPFLLVYFFDPGIKSRSTESIGVMTNCFLPSTRFFRNALVLATAFAIVGVMALSGLASATMPSTTAVTSITVGTGPAGVAMSPDGSSVWVTNGGDGTVSRIATSNNAVTSITVGANPAFVAVSPDGLSVWVTNYGDGTVSRINATTNLVADTITVGLGPFGVAVSPDGSSVWVANNGGGTVSRIIFPPQAPSNVTATPGDANATISWSAPTNTGGSPITGYSATASPGGKSCTTTTDTSCTISGLTNGTTYSVSVTASNAVGTSEPSVVAVTPAVPVVTATTAKLAATGSDLFSPSWLVVALFGLGGGALLVGRRRKTQPHS